MLSNPFFAQYLDRLLSFVTSSKLLEFELYSSTYEIAKMQYIVFVVYTDYNFEILESDILHNDERFCDISRKLYW